MDHEEQHFESPDFVKDIVIGMSDGLTVPFALAAGLSGAISNNNVIITAGIAEIVAGSIAMGLGGYLAGRTEFEHYESELRREYHEVETVPEREKEEIREILHEYDITPAVTEQFVDDLAKNKDKFVEFMMKFELGLYKPELKAARNSAIVIALAYIAGGIIPLSPYFFTDTSATGLELSVIITLVALFFFGYFKSRAIGQPVMEGALKTLVIGALAAGAAFFIAKLIS